MREVAIFRNNLFRISEPFVAQQAQPLQRYKPFYVGRMRFGPPPAGAESVAVEDLGRWRWPYIGWQMISRDPRTLARLMAAHRPALIHAHFGVDGVYALPLARRLKIPLVTTFHGFDATLSTLGFLRSPAWVNYPLFRHQLAKHGDLFLCDSEFLRARVLAMGFPEARTRLHYIGVDCGQIQVRDPSEETATVLQVGRLVDVKGTEYLIRGFALLAKKHPAVQLVSIGDGPLRGALEDLAKSLGIAERIQFLGARPHADVLSWMRRSAMLVLPSVRTHDGRTEGFGVVMAEAAATGLPVIGSRSGGIPEGIVDGRSGFLVPERDPAALASRMDDLLCDPELRRRMGIQARALVEQKFDIRRQTETLEGHYDAVLADAR
jgi:colanic acid/amylovoran biosynthesis glycosyltransferase